MKAKQPIDASFFKLHTGSDPKNDDLERCNCDKAGTVGHDFCGWNYRVMLPMFSNRHESPAFLVGNAILNDLESAERYTTGKTRNSLNYRALLKTG